MKQKFSSDEITLLLVSLEYSKQRIRDAKETPLKIRTDGLNEIEKMSEKLRAIKKDLLYL
jgi:hypothetical protein